MRGNVAFVRPDVLNLRKQWMEIEDCINGAIAVKYKTVEYLPMPNPSDQSEANKERYQDYLKRAVFYNVTRRTLTGLVGLVFQREPITELPTQLEGLIDNADGGGVNLTQIAKDCCFKGLAYGRTAILVDFPRADAPVSIAEAKKRGIQPSFVVYHPKNIINWRTFVDGGKKKLRLVVLAETEIVENPQDEFDMTTDIQYRVLRLTDGVYTQQLYRNNGTEPGEVFTPLDANGNPFDEIPFFPIGSETNTLDDVAPPAYDLATVNLAHYRNSADYEESCYIVGQPTLTIAGLTEQWVKSIFNNDPVEMGSRSAIALPEGAKAEILQAQPNSIVKEAMTAKEDQMVALGARLVQPKEGQRTATEARYDQANSDSVLATTAKNVGDGIKTALVFASKFMGADGSKLDFKLNTEFDLVNMSPEDISSLISSWTSNAIATSEMRERLKRGGIATLDYDEYRKEIEEDVGFAAENAKTMMEATTPEETTEPAN